MRAYLKYYRENGSASRITHVNYPFETLENIARELISQEELDDDQELDSDDDGDEGEEGELEDSDDKGKVDSVNDDEKDEDQRKHKVCQHKIKLLTRKLLKSKLLRAVFGPFVKKLVPLAKLHGIGLDGDDDSPYSEAASAATFQAVVNHHALDSYLSEYVLSKAVPKHFERAQRIWSDQGERVEMGIKLALQVFNASVQTALHSYAVSFGGKRLQRLRHGNDKYSLPTIDFDDMLYIPVLRRLPLFPNIKANISWCFVDEAQDTSRVRIIMLKRLAGGYRRIFIVGDRMQALYGWAGAESDALEQLFNQFKCTQFPMPVCRRCPISVINLANKVIESADNGSQKMKPMAGAVEGLVVHNATFASHPPRAAESKLQVYSGASSSSSSSCTSKNKDANAQGVAVLARRNAPLVACMYAMAARGIPCAMAGRGMLAKKMKSWILNKLLRTKGGKNLSLGTLDEVLALLDKFMDKQKAGSNATDKEKLASNASNDSEYEVNDLAECLRTVIADLIDRGKNSYRDLEQELLTSFGGAPSFGGASDNLGKGIIVELGTVHKAKGLGFGRVYILQPGELPLPFVMEHGKPWMQAQEINAQYVAYTRTEGDLIFLQDINGKKLRAAMEQLFPGIPPTEKARRAMHDEAEQSRRNFNANAQSREDDAWGSYRKAWQENGAGPQPVAGAPLSLLEACSLLGIAADTALDRLTTSKVGKLFRNACKNAHPDRCHIHGLTTDQANEQIQKLINAKETLGVYIERTKSL